MISRVHIVAVVGGIALALALCVPLAAQAQDVLVEAGGGLGTPTPHAPRVQHHVASSAPAEPAPPVGPDRRAERVLAMVAVEMLTVAAITGAGLATGLGGGSNGLEGGGLTGGLLGLWLAAPIAVHLTGGLVGGRGSLGGAVVGLLAAAGIAGALSGIVFLTSARLDDSALGALLAIDGALMLAGPLVGYEVSHDDARRAEPREPVFAPAVVVGPYGAFAGVRVAL